MLEKIVNNTDERDIFIILLASFAIVCFWRGTWQMLDKYFIPNNFLLSNLIPFLVGLLILLIIGSKQFKLKEKLNQRRLKK